MTTTSTSNAPSCNALVTVGTYHGVMAGLVLKKEKFFLKFSVKRHVGCLNEVIINGKYIATCGVDERVFIFTNKAEHKSAAVKQKLKKLGEPMAVRLADLGSITPPAEITHLLFCGGSAGQEGSTFLLCGSAEGQLLLYRTRDWSLHNLLSVHEKAVVAMAVHPTSGGMLVVSVAQDRSVAVLDLTKGKLLTKWKYNRNPFGVEEEGEKKASEEDEEGPKTKRRKLQPFVPNEEPVGVLYSTKGSYLVIFARYSFIVYDGQTMKAVDHFCFDSPQPNQELYCAAIVRDTSLLLGNEAGQIVSYELGTTEKSLKPVAVQYPPALEEEAQKLRGTPIDVNVETRLKTPLRHTARVKRMAVVDDTLFSVDSNGIVIAWRIVLDEKSFIRALSFITSANCRGRVTSMNVLEL
ncbi:protein MAK11 [Angomonas deanei]|nr:protein MAK11 [Angomonas deanei]|eukprot:EPY42912.1 protein MAK11 [Angomonas deanei]